MWSILIADNYPQSCQDYLEKCGFHVVYHPGIDRDELLKISSGFDVIIARISTPIDRDIVYNSNQLKVVASPTAGTNHIDLDACHSRGIKVFSAQGANAQSVAELLFALLFQVNRNIAEAITHVKSYGWNKYEFLGHELFGKTIGICGLGQIGRQIVTLGKAFGMQILTSDPYIKENNEIVNISLHDLFKRSDIVTLHVPLTTETEGFIGRELLESLPKNAIVANLSRGEIINENALNELLAGTRSDLRYLADVVCNEPRPGEKLVAPAYVHYPNTYITPHIGAWTVEAQERAGMIIAKKIHSFYQQTTVV